MSLSSQFSLGFLQFIVLDEGIETAGFHVFVLLCLSVAVFACMNDWLPVYLFVYRSVLSV